MFEIYKSIYDQIKDEYDSSLITEFWLGMSKQIGENFSTQGAALDGKFTHDPSIESTMVSNTGEIAKILPDVYAYLKARWPNPEWFIYLVRTMSTVRSSLAIQDITTMNIGDYDAVFTDWNMIYKLYELLHFLDEMPNVDMYKIRNIVEFGGGYGAMARLMTTLYPWINYTIIDLPSLLAVNYCYLNDWYYAPFVGIAEHRVKPIKFNLVTAKNKAILTAPSHQVINFVPIGLAKEVDISGEMFIAVASLNEAPDKCINWVADKDYFGAKCALTVHWFNEVFSARLAEKHPIVNGIFKPFSSCQYSYFSKTYRAKKEVAE